LPRENRVAKHAHTFATREIDADTGGCFTIGMAVVLERNDQGTAVEQPRLDRALDERYARGNFSVGYPQPMPLEMAIGEAAQGCSQLATSDGTGLR